MELLLKREIKTSKSTIGKLFINGVFECYILEDFDRGINKVMPVEDLKEKKVYAKTAIPSGQYRIIISFSERFKQYMPLLLNVPGYEGIRIHWGNTPEASAGCLLTGRTTGIDYIGESRKAFEQLFAKLQEAEKKEKIRITIE